MAGPAMAGSPEMGVALKVGVEVMASTAPVRGSMATTAPMSGPSCAAAKSCSRWSTVSVRSRGRGSRPSTSSTMSLTGFGSVWPIRMSSQTRSRPVVPKRRLA